MKKDDRRISLEVLYDRYARMVFDICYGICKDADAARSLEQDVFIALYEGLEKIDPGKEKSWLKSAAKNHSLNYIKKRKHEKAEARIELIMDYYATFPSCEELFLMKTEEDDKKIRAERICKILYEKNERWYDAITMTYFQGMKQTDVAKMMGMSENSLYVMMNRAKNWMKEHYNDDEDIR